MINNSLRYLQDSYSILDREWQEFLQDNCQEQLLAIDKQLSQYAKAHTIYPPAELIFRALALTPLGQVKVVILGQDPYHGENEANGLAFAINFGTHTQRVKTPRVKTPPSLRNIFQELAQEYAYPGDITPDILLNWARDGVLLLNCSLTVIKDQANSMTNLGWEMITDAIIKQISDTRQHVVFMLWGAFAKRKASLIDSTKHLILTTTHPSPLSAYRGFLGCNHFILANRYLGLNHLIPVTWL